MTYFPADNACIVWNSRVLNDFFQIWEVIPTFPDFIQLLLIFDDKNAALAVLDDVLASICSVSRVDTSSKTPGKNSSKI